jgi:DNA-binding transcriptional ArsR family regulator
VEGGRVPTTTDESRRAKRVIADAVPFALGRGIRIEILALLNEGVRTEAELARELRQPQSTTHHHLVELLNSGSIGETEGRRVGNLTSRCYRALTNEEYSADDYRRMTEVEQEETIAFTLQNAIAEHLAALRGGALNGSDPSFILCWQWLILDDEGREELTEQLEEDWRGLKAIVERSNARRKSSGDPGSSVTVSMIAHPRVRPAPEEKALGTLAPSSDP